MAVHNKTGQQVIVERVINAYADIGNMRLLLKELQLQRQLKGTLIIQLLDVCRPIESKND